MRKLALLLLPALMCGIAIADTIAMKDGKVIDGKVVMESGDTVIVKMADGTMKNLSRKNIAKIEKVGGAGGSTRKTYGCRVCYDTGKQKCPRCRGSGRAPGEQCTTCDGAGKSSCRSCGGNGGLKCPPCNGRGRIYHCVTTAALNGSLVIRDPYYTKCMKCNATGTAPCGRCRGKGQLICNVCNGIGRRPSSAPCGVCRGKRSIKCTSCGGASLAAKEKIKPDAPTPLTEGGRQAEIQKIEAELGQLQARLAEFKADGDAASDEEALLQYSAMSAEDRTRVRDIRAKLQGDGGYDYYCKMEKADKDVVERSHLLRNIIDSLGFPARRARKELLL